MAVNDTWKGLYGMLLDDLFLGLAQPSPSCQWYTRLLAARDTIFHAWITRTRGHTCTTTLISLTLSNLLAILDIRFLSLQGGHKAKRGMKLAKGLAPEWGGFLTRPLNMLHDNRFPDVISFINTQVASITGNTPADTHMVYLMTNGSQTYVARTAGHELLNHHSSSCFNCLILETTTAAGIKAAEAKAITLIDPSENGTELKHFSEIFRTHKPRPRKDTRQPRARKSKSARKRARNAHLKNKDAQWGEDANEHERSLKNAAGKTWNFSMKNMPKKSRKTARSRTRAPSHIQNPMH